MRGIHDEVGNAESVRCRGALHRLEVVGARVTDREARDPAREGGSGNKVTGLGVCWKIGNKGKEIRMNIERRKEEER